MNKKELDRAILYARSGSNLSAALTLLKTAYMDLAHDLPPEGKKIFSSVIDETETIHREVRQVERSFVTMLDDE